MRLVAIVVLGYIAIASADDSSDWNDYGAPSRGYVGPPPIQPKRKPTRGRGKPNFPGGFPSQGPNDPATRTVPGGGGGMPNIPGGGGMPNIPGGVLPASGYGAGAGFGPPEVNSLPSNAPAGPVFGPPGGISGPSDVAGGLADASGLSAMKSNFDFMKFLNDYRPQINEIMNSIFSSSSFGGVDVGSMCNSVQTGNWEELWQTMQKITSIFTTPPKVNKEAIANTLTAVLQKALTSIAEVIANASQGGLRPSPKLTEFIDNLVADILDFIIPEGNISYLVSGAIVNDLWQPANSTKLEWTDLPGLHFLVELLPQVPAIILSHIDFPEPKVSPTPATSEPSGLSSKIKGGPSKYEGNKKNGPPKKPESITTPQPNAIKPDSKFGPDPKKPWAHKPTEAPKPQPGKTKPDTKVQPPTKPATTKLSTKETDATTEKPEQNNKTPDEKPSDKPGANKPESSIVKPWKPWTNKKKQENDTKPSPVGPQPTTFYKYSTKPTPETDKAKPESATEEPIDKNQKDSTAKPNSPSEPEYITPSTTISQVPQYESSWAQPKYSINQYGYPVNVYGYPIGYDSTTTSPGSGNEYLTPEKNVPISPGNDILPYPYGKYSYGALDESPANGSEDVGTPEPGKPGHEGYKMGYYIPGYPIPISGQPGYGQLTYATASSSASATATAGTNQPGYANKGHQPDSKNPNDQPIQGIPKSEQPNADKTSTGNETGQPAYGIPADDKPGFGNGVSETEYEYPEENNPEYGNLSNSKPGYGTNPPGYGSPSIEQYRPTIGQPEYGNPENSQQGYGSPSNPPGYVPGSSQLSYGGNEQPYESSAGKLEYGHPNGSPGSNQPGYGTLLSQPGYESEGNKQPSFGTATGDQPKYGNPGTSPPGYNTPGSSQPDSGNNYDRPEYSGQQPRQGDPGNKQPEFGTGGNIVPGYGGENQPWYNKPSIQPGYGNDQLGYQTSFGQLGQISASASSASSATSNSGYSANNGQSESSVSASSSASNPGYLNNFGQPGESGSIATSTSSASSGGSNPGYTGFAYPNTGDASAKAAQSGVTSNAGHVFLYGPFNNGFKFFPHPPTFRNPIINGNLNGIPKISSVVNPGFAPNSMVNGIPTFKPWVYDANAGPNLVGSAESRYNTNGLTGFAAGHGKPFQSSPTAFNYGNVPNAEAGGPSTYTVTTQDFKPNPFVIKQYNLPNIHRHKYIDFKNGKVNVGSLDNGQSLAIGDGLKLSVDAGNNEFGAGKSQFGVENKLGENNNIDAKDGVALNTHSFELNGFKLPIFGINGKVKDTKYFKIPKP